MRAKNIYYLYDGDKLIGEFTAREIAEKLCYCVENIYIAERNGTLLGKQYRVKRTKRSIPARVGRSAYETYELIENGKVIAHGYASDIAKQIGVNRIYIYKSADKPYRLKRKYYVRRVRKENENLLEEVGIYD